MSEVLLLNNLPPPVQDAIAQGNDRTMCPKCAGGSGQEYSLSIRRNGDDNQVKLSCWRSTCDWYAYVFLDGNVKFETRKVKPAVYYSEPTIPLQGLVLDHIRNYCQLDVSVAEAHGWRQNGDTLVMPVRSPFGGDRGHVTRTFDTPKRCMTYKATAQPWLDWWITEGEDYPLVIVEDCLSACRLSGLGYNAVALLGTSITVDQAKEIAQFAGEQPVFIALDNDAFEKAIKLVSRHKHIVPMKPVLLTQDIKNMENDSDIHNLFIPED